MIWRWTGGVLRNTPEEAVASATRMISEAKDWLPTLWIGPPPVNDDDMPFSSAPGRERFLSSSRNVQLSDMFQDVAADLGVPYLDIFTPLSAHSDGPNIIPKAMAFTPREMDTQLWPIISSDGMLGEMV